MTTGRKGVAGVPEPVRQILSELSDTVGVCTRIRVAGGIHDGEIVFTSGDDCGGPAEASEAIAELHDGRHILELPGGSGGPPLALIASLVAPIARRAYDFANEIQFFTAELSERYEEINLLYSISETLGSARELEDAARLILEEVCDVLSARRGTLWTHDVGRDVLDLVASVGEPGREGPLDVRESDSVTAAVFREERARIATVWAASGRPGTDSLLCVPVRYSPRGARSRTVGVLNLLGRKEGGRFTAGDQKLLAAIASQIGAALENRRLLLESLRQERIQREMELAHDLQMKLLPPADSFVGAQVAARVEPADSVGGDFYQLLKLSDDRVGVMIGDVSGHGFPAALIMTLTMSAAAIYAAEFVAPGEVLGRLAQSLQDELESTEMYLTLFYGVVDAKRGCLIYANAGHPYAFAVRADGSSERLEAIDPPVGLSGEERYGEAEVPWGSDDLLLLFTDGLPQALLGMDVGEGERRLVAEAVSLRTQPPSEIVPALFALASGFDSEVPPDDRTAIVLRT